MLLKSLRFYHNNDSPQEKIHKHKENYILLYKKGLHELANKEIQKASKIAEENEFFSEKVLLAHWQNNEALFSEFYYDIDSGVEENLDKPLAYIEDLKEYHLYVILCRRIEIFQVKHNLRTQKNQETLAEFAKNPLLIETNEPLSFLSNYHKIKAKTSCYTSMKQYDKANVENKKLIDLKLQNPKMHQANPLYLYGDYYNYACTLIHITSWDKIEPIRDKCINALENLKTGSYTDDYDRMIFDLNFFLELKHSLLQGKIDRIPTILTKVEEKFVHIQKELVLDELYFLYYYYNLAYACFIIGSYEKAQKYLIPLLNSPILKNRKDYLAATHILNLFTHYELGNFDYLSYQLKNTKHLLQRKAYLYNFEEKAIDLLSKLCKVKTEKKQSVILEYHQIVFDDLVQQVWEIEAFERFDIRYWISQKLERVV